MTNIKDMYVAIFKSTEFKRAFVDCWNDWNRVKRNKMMYDVFTPFYVKWWHKIKGEKPYLNLNYKPKF